MDFLAPSRILQLPPQLANQIAAGEVVERPASVVKELLENSLDAGARQLEIDIEQGGLRLIRIRDNGAGIHPEDLVLALSPHATSKIRHAEELMAVRSLGFRGEALASVASVSRLTLASRTSGDESGWQLGGEDAQPVPAAHPQGTTVEVRDLFYNVPARRKFLRAERTEFAHVEALVRRLALSRFDVAITLRHNQRSVLTLRAAPEAAGQEKRLVTVLGRAFLEHTLRLEFEAAGMKLWGWVGRADYSRSQSDLQFFYLNGRNIRDRLVGHALRQAFREVLDAGRFPAYVLYLELDPAAVDVNVHPTKHEVRFRETRLVHDFLFRAVSQALQAPQDVVTDEVAIPAVPRSQPRESDFGRLAAREPVTTYSRRGGAQPARSYDGPAGARSSARIQRYLFTENEEGVLLVDLQPVFRRRVLTRLKQAFYGEGIHIQPLLIPVSLSIGAAEEDAFERVVSLLPRFGFDIGKLGPGMLLVRQIPSALRDVEPRGPVMALLAALGGLADPKAAETEADPILEVLAKQVGVPERLDMADQRAIMDEALRGQAGQEWVCLTPERIAGLLRSDGDV